jgi:hypothetical protein
LLQNSEKLLERTESSVEGLAQLNRPNLVFFEGRFQLLTTPLLRGSFCSRLLKKLALLGLGRYKAPLTLAGLTLIACPTLLDHIEQLFQAGGIIILLGTTRTKNQQAA